MLGALRSAVLCIAVTAACTPTTAPSPGAVRYLGVETMLLEDDLVNFVVTMDGAATKDQAADYARCAAAQYTRIRGFGFTRHVRTQVGEKGGVLVADAIYTVSPTLPAGIRTIDAHTALADCEARGIPTV